MGRPWGSGSRSVWSRPVGARCPHVATPLKCDAALFLSSSVRHYRCCSGEEGSQDGENICRSISGQCKPHFLSRTDGREGTKTLSWPALPEQGWWRLCRLCVESFLRTPRQIRTSRKKDHETAHACCVPREENGSRKGDGRKNNQHLVHPARPLRRVPRPVERLFSFSSSKQ